MQNDVFYQDLKAVYLTADFEFRTGKIDARQLSETHLDVFTKMLSQYETLQPHLYDFEQEALKNWQTSLASNKNAKVKEYSLADEPKVSIEDLRNKYLLADFAFRKKQLPIQSFIKTTSEVIIKLLDRTDQIQPYLSQFLEAANKQWNEKK
jgi:hypothetical protein